MSGIEQPSEELRRLALLLEYDGTAYSGSQFQGNAPSIQCELEKAIQQLVGEAIRVKMAGRTDAGVHAKGQVASLLTKADYRTEEFVNALNYYLPGDIAVKDAKDVPLSFDVRRDATARTYRYAIYNGSQRSPLLSRTAWQVLQPLDITAMRQAAGYLIGRHDFASFAPASERSTRREVYQVDVCRQDDLTTIDIERTPSYGIRSDVPSEL